MNTSQHHSSLPSLASRALIDTHFLRIHLYCPPPPFTPSLPLPNPLQSLSTGDDKARSSALGRASADRGGDADAVCTDAVCTGGRSSSEEF
eukprot:707552-Amorphochlora_amoeboformis.AAC.1